MMKPRHETATKPIIALVAHGVHDHGGMERACAELVRHAHDTYDFVVISAELAPELRTLVREWRRIRAPAKPIPLRLALFWLHADHAVKSVKADLVHAVGAITPSRLDLATIQYCHAGLIASQGRHASPSAPLTRRVNTTVTHLLALAAERWCYRRGRLRSFAAVSSGVSEELLAHYPGIEVHLTPNGVDIDRFQPNAGVRAQMRRAAGLADEPIALFVGGDWDRKGLAVCIEALAMVRNAGVDLRLWVVGPGDRDRFTALAKEFRVASAISFYGARADTELFYAASDMFVLPTAYEALSLVTLEAAASGLPTIMPPVNGALEVVGDDEAGIVVERTPDSVAAAVTRLARNVDERVRLGRWARQRASQYNWASSVNSVTRLYASLLDEDAKRSRVGTA